MAAEVTRAEWAVAPAAMEATAERVMEEAVAAARLAAVAATVAGEETEETAEAGAGKAART